MAYTRRKSHEITVGNIRLGGDNPIRVQSMTNTSTMDTEASVAQILRIAKAGGELVRLTTQGTREADNMELISKAVRQAGSSVPLVADVHFNPNVADVAAHYCEKVRINPGNYVDAARQFKQLEYTDEQYAQELQKIEARLLPFLQICREHGTAVRIGVNHGSLSDRIMSRYGDTPEGIVESCMEFLRICVRHDFMNVVISIKASNTVIMVHTVRLLVRAMDAENMHFPLHLGVTEAGDGEDGRVRSAVGIGTLLAEGIGDTIRVSLSEPPECEVPVARELADYITSRASAPSIEAEEMPGFANPDPTVRRVSRAVGICGGENVPVVEGLDPLSPADIAEVTASEVISGSFRPAPGKILVISSSHANPVGEISAAVHALMRSGAENPVIARLDYGDLPQEKVTIRAAADFGTLFMRGLIDGISLRAATLSEADRQRLALGILQAVRRRVTRTEFVSCPGCGRTMFDLPDTVRRVKEATSHLKGLKIAVMGCIVNGPGEMADADYGYVGAAKGHITLYRGKTPVIKNIPSQQAVESLIELLKADGVWREPSL